MDMSPMIDLVFLLLIFFMVSSHIIVVKLDPEVKPPVADSALPPDVALGRIVVNIRTDGEVVDVQSKVLSSADGDMNEVERYVSDAADALRRDGIGRPKLHLRADRDVEVKRIKEVVKAAANAQVIDVIFATYKEG